MEEMKRAGNGDVKKGVKSLKNKGSESQKFKRKAATRINRNISPTVEIENNLVHIYRSGYD